MLIIGHYETIMETCLDLLNKNPDFEALGGNAQKPESIELELLRQREVTNIPTQPAPIYAYIYFNNKILSKKQDRQN